MISSLAKTWRTMLCASLAIGFLFNSGFSQKQEKKAQPAQAPGAEQTDVLRINTTLLQVDAIVRDGNGQAVTDLRAEDFVIVDNGRAYPAEYCSYINLASERARTAAPTDGRLSKNELGRAIAFIITRPIIDANVVLTTPSGDIRSGSASNRSLAATDANNIRRLLHQFVDHQIGSRDLVAIHSTERDLGVLANFTTDRDALRAAIEHATKPVPAASWVRVMVTNDGIAGNLVDQNLAVLQTLSNAIEQVQTLPGRKLVVLVSRGFIIHPRLTRSEQVRERLRELTAQANRAGIAIYPLNPRGLGLTSGTLQDMDSLIALSQETGGRSVYNTNDLSLGFGEILKENEGYYLLGYQLADDDPNAPHKIKVQVKRPHLKAQSRQTIYSATRLFKPGETNLNVALNTPFALRDIGVNLTPVFHSPDGKTLRVTSLLNVALAGVTMEPQADSGRAIALELAAQVIGSDRKVIKQETRALSFTLSAENLKAVEQQGIPFSFRVDVPTPGHARINVAVRDTRSGRIGNASRVIEVADLSRGALTASSLILLAANDTGAESAPKQQFAPGERLRYQCFVYNARSLDSDHTAHLRVTVRLRLGDKVVSQT